MPNKPRLVPDDQFPKQAVDSSVQVQPKPDSLNPISSIFTLWLAGVSDSITQWGKNPKRRDAELRDFWPTESYLAGTVASNAFRNASYEWEIHHSSNKVEQAVTDMLLAAIAGDSFGWSPFIQKFSQDLSTQDNGGFIELIRDETISNAFKGPRAPVVGIAHLDAGRCKRTGNIEIPVIYTDKNKKEHKLKWYQVIPFSDFPSAIESMHGVGYCAVTRALRLAQIMRSIEVYKDEKISGRHAKSLHIIGGVARSEIDDVIKRETENADNQGFQRYMGPIILASLDPEKSVSTATVDLAGLPDGFDLDTELKWYISGLALAFGVDYQELAPLPGGGLGSAAQSTMLHKKSFGRWPATFMRSITEAFKNYGVLPAGATMIFNDKNEQEEIEKQEVRTRAMEEAAIAARSQIFPRKAIAQDLIDRGIFTEKIMSGIPEDFWMDKPDPSGNPVGQRGGNTIREDANRQNTGKPNQTVGDRLRKLLRRDES